MGVIQNSVNQALGIGALIAGKATTDHNNSVIAAEENNVKLRKELYNKTENKTITDKEIALKEELNAKFEDNFEKYTGIDKDGKVHKGKQFFKNSELKRYYESQNLDRNIALNQPGNATNKVTNRSKSNSDEINEYMDKSLFKGQKGHIIQMELPSIQQVMAEQQMNKVDQMNEFKHNTKEELNLRKDVVKNKGKYVVNMNTINGKPLNPNDTNNDIPTWKAKQMIAKQMELDSKNIKENK